MEEGIVSVFGTGRAGAAEPICKLAYELGKSLAQAGFAIANGGYGGTMLAAAKGAREAGGQVIGVTCSAFKSKPNPYITRQVVTKSLDERLNTLIDLGQGYVVLAGGTGTLLELAKVWELKNKGFLTADRPIILVGDFWRPLVELIARDDPDAARQVKIVKDAQQAVQLLAEDIGLR